MEEQNTEESDSNNIDVKIKIEKKRTRQHRLLCELLMDFAKNTTLHGLRYVTERGLSLAEKIFWIIKFLLSLTVCIFLIYKVWVKYQSNNVIVTFSERVTDVSEVPFPAITICPHAKIDQRLYSYNKSFYDFESMLRKFDDTDDFNETFIRELTEIRLICNDFRGTTKMLQYFFRGLGNHDHTTVKKLIEVAPKLDELFFIGNWILPFDVWRDPFEIFSQVLTEEGVCFTFNSLAADEILNVDQIQKNYSYLDEATASKGWSLNRGFFNSSYDTYPRRGQENGAQPVLDFVFQELMARDKLCDGEQPGFKVYLHHPGDLPQSSLNYYTAVPGQENFFALSVDVLKSSASLSQCPADIRQCYFPGERALKYFKVYSQSNCQLECMANFSLANCGCVWFHMPHNDSTVICNFYVRSNCTEPALERYFSEEGTTMKSRCNCLPSCDSIQYEAEVLRTSAKYQQCIGCYSENETIINMYFKKPIFVSRVRECTGMFELTDFLAYCGGLLGLFLGFSFLSLVEIFYFCTLRWYCKFRRISQAGKKENIHHVKSV